MKSVAALTAAAVLFLAGCKHDIVNVVPAGKTPQATALESQQNSNLSKAAAYAQATKVSVDAGPDGRWKDAALGSIDVSLRYLPTPAPADLSVALASANQALNGQLKEAQDGWKKAQQDSDEAREKLAKAQADLEAERAASAKKLEDILKRKDAEIQSAKDEANRQVMREQARWLNIGGVVGVGIFAIMIGIGGLPAISRSWVFALVGVECFGLAQLISQPWFMWACGGAAVVGLALIGWWVWEHEKSNDLTAAVEDKAQQVSGVLGAIVPTIEKAKETLSEAEQVGPNKLLELFSKAMDASHKAVVAQVQLAAKHGTDS